MKIKVLYFSKGGNTKKVADKIASTLGQVSEAIPPAYPLENVNLLFLGGAVYAGKVNNKMIEFIGTLNTKRVKNVALFTTSGGQDTALTEMRDLLKAKGINVLEDTFMCKGKFFIFINRTHPDSKDLKRAEEFAKSASAKIKE